jgi:hypothetical protein
MRSHAGEVREGADREDCSLAAIPNAQRSGPLYAFPVRAGP